MIFTLLYNDGSFMLSRNFRLQKVGDMSWLRKNYNFSKVAFSIDELIVLDVSRRGRNISEFSENLKVLTRDCFVPIAAGGGLRSLTDAKMLLRSGADKVVVNTPLFDNPKFVKQLASEFGKQCIVASVDVKKHQDLGYQLWVENASRCIDGNFRDVIKGLMELPVGELYLNSIDRDGTGNGYDMILIDALPSGIEIPVIIAGGAGHYEHLETGLGDDRVDAFATAHLFNFVGDGLSKARENLLKKEYHLASWNIQTAIHLKDNVKA